MLSKNLTYGTFPEIDPSKNSHYFQNGYSRRGDRPSSPGPHTHPVCCADVQTGTGTATSIRVVEHTEPKLCAHDLWWRKVGLPKLPFSRGLGDRAPEGLC